MSQPTPLMTIMIDAVRKASKGLKRDFGELENLQTAAKAPGDFVTKADLRVEQALFESLSKSRPGYGFLGEERGMVEGTDKTHTFIADPIDGTTNLIHGLPHFAINLALSREGAIVAGVTYNPITDELYWAEKGKGAYMGNTRLRVAARKDLRDALIVCGMPHLGRPGHKDFLVEYNRIAPVVSGVRRTGSAALDMAYVAAGRYDVFWERNLKPWDIAAGLILVREAGGMVEDLSGHKDVLNSGDIAVGNPDLLPKFVKALNG